MLLSKRRSFLGLAMAAAVLAGLASQPAQANRGHGYYGYRGPHRGYYVTRPYYPRHYYPGYSYYPRYYRAPYYANYGYVYPRPYPYVYSYPSYGYAYPGYYPYYRDYDGGGFGFWLDW